MHPCQVEDLGVQLETRCGPGEDKLGLARLTLEELLETDARHLVSHSCLDAAAAAEHSKLLWVADEIELVVLHAVKAGRRESQHVTWTFKLEASVKESKVCFIGNDDGAFESHNGGAVMQVTVTCFLYTIATEILLHLIDHRSFSIDDLVSMVREVDLVNLVLLDEERRD